ncbi:MAG TPA: alkaline phosphatase D family protein [Pseudonocardiaceae bacterium]|nr:alkaline phosphatase D family protein [Pseudonocardiaceae bacterium]
MTIYPAGARLLLGPVLRHVGATTATVWVQADRPAEVEVLGCRASTFTVHGHHYALVEVGGLEPGSTTTYQVHLNGERVWPRPGWPWLASRIRTRGGGAVVRVVFGSCRCAKPENPRSAAVTGIDALDVQASRMADTAPQTWPDALLLLGDQVYADDPPPQTRRRLPSRRHATAPPEDEVANFVEYARLYRDSWSDDGTRWLMSTVPTAMIFDDHDVRDDWNTSAAWRDEMTAYSWWPSRIRGALAAYWIYQHIGNLSPKERHSDPIWRAVQDTDGDAWPVLKKMADAADADPATIRWSFRWDIDGVRLVVIDTRCGRVLIEGRRAMLDDAEFSWVEDAVSEGHDAQHVLVGSSLPWLLAPAIHDVQSANEVACARDSTRGERIRQAFDLEHWAAFRDSFDRLAALLRRVAVGPHAPATISVLSGDVHHSYVARADVDGSPVYQLVCSPVHHHVPWYITALMRAAWFGPPAALVRRAVRRYGVPDPALSWRLISSPVFGNAVATLVFSERNAELVIEKSSRSGGLEPVSRVELAAPNDRRQEGDRR